MTECCFKSFSGKEVDQIHWLAKHLREKLNALQHVRDINVLKNGLLMQLKCLLTNNNEIIHHLVTARTNTRHPAAICSCSVMNAGAVVDGQHFYTSFMLRWSKREASVWSYQLTYSSFVVKMWLFPVTGGHHSGKSQFNFHFISDMGSIRKKIRDKRQKMRRKVTEWNIKWMTAFINIAFQKWLFINLSFIL